MIRYAIKARLFKEDLRNKGAEINKRSWKYPYMIRNEVFFVNRYGNILFKSVYVPKLLSQYIIGIVTHIFKGDKKYAGRHSYSNKKCYRRHDRQVKKY